MATTRRETSTPVKEKRGTSPLNSKPSPRKATSSSSTASDSTEKQLPNYLKPTKSSRTDAALKNLKKPGAEDPCQSPSVMRRRSFDRPPSAARAHKALISPVRQKSASASASTSTSPSFSSKSATAPKAPLERVAKKAIAAAKPHTQTLSSSRRAPNTTTSATTRTSRSKRGTSTPPMKPPSSPDRKEAQSPETKHENKENVDHQVEPEEVVKDDEDEMYDTNLPKAEETANADALDVDTNTQVTSDTDEGGQDTADFSNAVSQEHNETETEPETEPEPQSPSEHEHEPKPEKVEDKVEEGKPDHTQHDCGDKENHSQEEIIAGADPQQEKTPLEDQEVKTETEYGEENATNEVVAATKETEEEQEEKQPESRQEDADEGNQPQGLESIKEKMVKELDAEPEKEQKAEIEAEPEADQKAETEAQQKTETEAEKKTEPKAEAKQKAGTEVANVAAKSQVQGKKEPATPYNDVIEETASKLVAEKRRNKVRELVGAFENVIDKETTNAK
ncbi:immunoglobulin A1 protease autotransporter isoform X3 [Gossypium hirsutum]|uniref:Immunoglobulin A1 protease autotransporter isoform X3 n=1 Tax=Gossypium hirsutum TaxID=3635 RepID=A0ABM3BPH3_GOSHI|nr:immunoglobulin A1 protease autotransporter-like isoform X3 [Gossypium hirsutum]